MRNIALIIILLIPNLTMDSFYKQDELLELSKVVQNHDLEIEEWIVTLTEKINKKRANKLIKRLKQEHSVLVTQSETSTQYLVQELEPYNDIFITYKAIIPNDKKHLATLTVEIKGFKLDDFSTNLYRKVDDLVTRTYFTKNANRYTCLIAKSDDIIKDVVFMEKIPEKLNFTHIFTQTDTVFKSTHNKIIYGYIKEWNNKIKLHNDMVNVQIALTSTESNKQRIIIGTPILINEY